MNKTETELLELVNKIQVHQKALDLSDEKFVARYRAQLSSVKTWRYKLVGGDLSEVGNAEKWRAQWVQRLSALVLEIEGVRAPASYLKEFEFALRMTARLSELENIETDRRCLIGLAVTGCGKSAWAGAMVAAAPSRRIYILANESWREKPYVAAVRIAQRLGVDPGRSYAEAVDAVRLSLSVAPKTIFIDSAQEAGIALMKLIRDWIDGTRSYFVYLGYATEYDRMVRATGGAVDEAKQLLGRSLKPVYDAYRHGLRRKDVKVFLTAAGIQSAAADALAEEILPTVLANGNLRFLGDAIDDARAAAADKGEDLKPDHIRVAAADLSPARKEAK